MTQQRFILAVAFVWFFAALAALAFFASAKLEAFDPNGKLLDAAASADFDRQILQQITSSAPAGQGAVFHFSSDNCECNLVAQEHRESVKSLASEQGFNNVDINVNKRGEILNWLPSTPAIAVVNAVGKLTYLGPYSAGYSCAPGDGIVERFITNQNQTMPGATVVSDTLGCYCNL